MCGNEREAFKNYLADFWECQGLGKEAFTLLGRKTTSIFLKTNFMIIMFEIKNRNFMARVIVRVDPPNDQLKMSKAIREAIL